MNKSYTLSVEFAELSINPNQTGGVESTPPRRFAR